MVKRTGVFNRDCAERFDNGLKSVDLRRSRALLVDFTCFFGIAPMGDLQGEQDTVAAKDTLDCSGRE
jgi:hypothetical protein